MAERIAACSATLSDTVLFAARPGCLGVLMIRTPARSSAPSVCRA